MRRGVRGRYLGFATAAALIYNNERDFGLDRDAGGFVRSASPLTSAGANRNSKDELLITLERLLRDRSPVRRGIRSFIKKLGLGSYSFRSSIGAVERPNYAHLVFQAATLAAKLGLPRTSVIEFGVAGGGGLLMLEHHAREVERLIPSVKIETYGFDTGIGLPPPTDYRDLPFHWREGFFAMDRQLLEAKVSRSKLIFGNISDTIDTFTQTYDPAPVGAIAIDVDLYSSTKAALKIFQAAPRYLLPRVLCFFDDVMGGDIDLMSDYTGERLAISEFNAENELKKLSPAYHLRVLDGGEAWRHQVWVAHLFDHPRYNQFVSYTDQQLTISGAQKLSQANPAQPA